METCVIVVGNQNIIASNPGKALGLYRFFEPFFSGLEYKVITKNAESDINTIELIGDAELVFAHSQGASRVAHWLDNHNYKQLQHVILLDPLDRYLNNWNKLKKKKIIFSSGDPAVGDNYRGLDNVIELNDDHFFSDSRSRMLEIIMGLVSFG